VQLRRQKLASRHYKVSIPMRKIIFGGANSLDNYIAKADNAVDWLLWNDEVAEIISNSWKSFDAVLMGRKTYEVSLSSGMGGATPGVASFVFSRTLENVEGDATLVRENAAEFVRQLKQKPGKDICVMGGGEFGRFLLDADLIDVVGVNIHPLLMGSGIPLFHPLTRQVNLELDECRRLKNGCVYLTYNVKR
jgi:dihydrofolate reductase